MSLFKTRPIKHRHINNVNTLDQLHRQTELSFERKKKSLPRKKNKLKKLERELVKLENMEPINYTTDDIKKKSRLKTDIEKIKDDIYDIENNVSEMEYYSKTGDIIIEYYTLLDKDDYKLYDYDEDCVLSQQKDVDENTELDQLEIWNRLKTKSSKAKKPAKKRGKQRANRNNTNIMELLECVVDDTDNDEKDRYELFDAFRMLTDNEYMAENSRSCEYERICPSCDVSKTFHHNDGIYVCPSCGEVDMIISEPERHNYKDIVPDKPAYPYKRINHYREWLSQFQAKESTEIPIEVYDAILLELRKNKFYDLKKLTLKRLKKILKKLDFNGYYEHATHIMCKLSGLPPPSLSREQEEELIKMFKQIQAPFETHCPKNRVNFLSYSYVLHKFCELLELDDLVKYFPLLKSREKLRMQDKIWENICRDLKWEFIKSI